MALALAEKRIIVSADTDFGALLASTRATSPSVILVRELLTLPPRDLAAVVVDHLDVIEAHLEAGAVMRSVLAASEFETFRCAELLATRGGDWCGAGGRPRRGSR